MIDDKAAGTRQLFIELIESKELAMKDVPEAIAIAKISPSADQWQNFINTLLLWFGSLTLAFGVIFFVAANWQELGRLGKFAIVEGAKSNRTQGNEKLVWLLLIVFVSWFAWVFYVLLAPLKKIPTSE